MIELIVDMQFHFITKNSIASSSFTIFWQITLNLNVIKIETIIESVYSGIFKQQEYQAEVFLQKNIIQHG